MEPWCAVCAPTDLGAPAPAASPWLGGRGTERTDACRVSRKSPSRSVRSQPPVPCKTSEKKNCLSFEDADGSVSRGASSRVLLPPAPGYSLATAKVSGVGSAEPGSHPLEGEYLRDRPVCLSGEASKLSAFYESMQDICYPTM